MSFPGEDGLMASVVCPVPGGLDRWPHVANLGLSPAHRASDGAGLGGRTQTSEQMLGLRSGCGRLDPGLLGARTELGQTGVRTWLGGGCVRWACQVALGALSLA